MQSVRSETEITRRYRAKYRLEDAAFRAFDGLIGLFFRRADPAPIPDPRAVRRVLIANAGHLGDLVFTTAVVNAVRVIFPDVRIGILAGSWSREIFEECPSIDRLHLLDHWFTSRAPASRWRKFVRYASERRRVEQELRDACYDIAIDVRMWFPNFVPLIRSARVPVRLGFDRVGFGPLLTAVGVVRYGGQHEVDAQVSLLRLVSERAPLEGQARLSLPPGDDVSRGEVDALLTPYGEAFRVLHMGSSTATRDWPAEKWRALADRLAAAGHLLVFTGAGARDADRVRVVTDGLTGHVNACDRLSWPGLVELVRRAALVYCTETSVGHVASAVNTPVVAIYGGTGEPARWRPYGSNCRVVTHEPPCFPCLRRSGCAEMTCLAELSVDSVHAAGEAIVRR